MARIGKYELGRKLANGGMAEVFLAKFEWAHGLEKTVVVKRILQHLAEDPTFIEMFFSEAQLAAQLSHPNIAQIIEFGESEGIHFLSMEYVDGPNLRALAGAAHAQSGGLPFPHCARIAAFCCEALTHAHELTDAATGKPLDLVHRDVSPDNILVSRTGSVKLVDFGIAKAATQSHQTRTGLVKGKLAYMAPEQLRAEPLDRRADIFALGVVLYELLAGVKPFDASSEVTLIHAMLYEEMVPLRNRRPHVPPELERIVNRALERDRDHRYPDCRAMHADLEEYLLSTRLAVSALQIAQLVEKHRVAQSRAEGATPSPALATPSRQGPAARTPQPWRAEHTPTEAPTAQLRRPLLRTATDDGGETIPLTQRKMPAAAPPEFIRGTEMAPPPVAAAAVAPSPSQTPRPAPRPHQSPAPAARSWAPVIVGVTGMVALFAGTTAVLWPVKRPQEEQPAPPVQKPVVSEAVAGPPDQPPGPPQGRAQARSVSETPPAPKPPPVRQQVELVVQSDPPAMLKVIAGGKVRASQQGRVITHVLPGPVEIEATGSGQQPFAKRESITLDPLVKRHEHTITVRAGTVQIHSFPPSRVTVDGVYMGDTPRKLRLYEGEHSIQFWCDRTIAACAGGLEATQKIVVEPGKETSVTQWW